jgi:hypothetical protein
VLDRVYRAVGNALIKSVTVSTDERQQTRGTEREIYLDHSNHILRLNEGRLLRKVQNRKTIFTTMTFVAIVGKSVSSQHQNLIGFCMENAENGYMKPLPCMDCFVIFVERIKREKTTRNKDRNNEEVCCGICPTS